VAILMYHSGNHRGRENPLNLLDSRSSGGIRITSWIW